MEGQRNCVEGQSEVCRGVEGDVWRGSGSVCRGRRRCVEGQREVCGGAEGGV